MRTLIKNGQIVTAVDSYTADVLIDGSLVSMIGTNLSGVTGAVDRTIEAMDIRRATGTTVLAVMREGNPVVKPPGDSLLKPRGRMLALGTGERLERLERLMAGRRSAMSRRSQNAGGLRRVMHKREGGPAV